MGKKKINKKDYFKAFGVFPVVETPSSTIDMTDVDSYMKRRKLNTGGMSKDRLTQKDIEAAKYQRAVKNNKDNDRLTQKDIEAADDAVKGRKYTIINDDGALGGKKIVKRNNGGMVSDYIKDLL